MSFLVGWKRYPRQLSLVDPNSYTLIDDWIGKRSEKRTGGVNARDRESTALAASMSHPLYFS